MAATTKSAGVPPSPGENEKPQNAGAEDVKPADQESAGDTFTKLIAASVEPLREEQVQNAVKFLSHPKVRGSPIVHRRSFLEKKGLTKEEINEAFRRVPDPSSSTANVEASIANQVASQTPSATGLQPQGPGTTTQHAYAPLGVIPAPSASQRYKFQWSHALLAIGILTASSAGTAVFIKNVILPRFKAWIRKVAKEEDDFEKKDNKIEEAVEAAKTAASAAAIIAKTSQELLNTRTEEGKYFESFKDLLSIQMEELKSMGSAIRRLESTREVTLSYDKQMQEWNNHGLGNGLNKTSSYLDQQGKTNGMLGNNLNAGRPTTVPTSVETTSSPYSKSYMEIMAMIQRGETPPGIKEINDMPPNPNQPPTNPRVAPRIKPWEVIQQDQRKHDLGSPMRETSDGYSEVEGNGHFSQINGKPLDSSGSSWEQRTVKITEEPEIEEQNVVSHGIGSSEWRGRGWVPPQPPSVAIPEAAVAIRQPKSVPKQPMSQRETSQPSTIAMPQAVERQPNSSSIEQPNENKQSMTQNQMLEHLPVLPATTKYPNSSSYKQQVEIEHEAGSSGGEAIISAYSEMQEEPVAGVAVN